MALELPVGMKLELAKLEQDALLELWDIDLTRLTSVRGTQGIVYRLHNGVNEKGESVVWKGQTYQPYPIKGSGFEATVKGTSNRPTLAVSNLFGLVTGLVNEFDDCLGAIVCRRQVYANNLDPVNFANNSNPKHNVNNEIVNYYVIEQVESLAVDVVRFKLAIPTELDGLLLPARMMMSNTCQFIYRSPECGYTGRPVADEKDQPTADPKKDKCSKCLTGCSLRNNTRNFGAYIAIDKL